MVNEFLDPFVSINKTNMGHATEYCRVVAVCRPSVGKPLNPCSHHGGKVHNNVIMGGKFTIM